MKLFFSFKQRQDSRDKVLQNSNKDLYQNIK